MFNLIEHDLFNRGGMWDSNPRMSDPQTDVLTKLHQYRHKWRRVDSNRRTRRNGFTDRRV